jgi:sugar phosphate isomerase/epimerase
MFVDRFRMGSLMKITMRRRSALLPATIAEITSPKMAVEIMTNLGLGQLTAVEVGPLEYVDIAAASGCQFVSLFVRQPGPQAKFPLTTRDNCTAVSAKLRKSGVQVGSVECFMLVPNVDVEQYRPELQLGAELGAKGATALLYDNDEARTLRNLTRLCQIAAEVGLRINVEFMPLAPLGRNICDAAALVDKVGAPNLGLCVDLLHLIRSGGTPADVAAVDPQRIFCAQLCDSMDLSVTNDYVREAGVERLAPGDGKFPVQDFLRALPAQTLIELEVPQSPELPAAERVQRIVAAARKQMALAGV